MAKKQRVERTPCLTQVHVDDDTVVEVMNGESGFWVNIYRNAQGWKEILFEEYTKKEEVT